jgi:hypothetical protein
MLIVTALGSHQGLMHIFVRSPVVAHVDLSLSFILPIDILFGLKAGSNVKATIYMPRNSDIKQ